MILQIREQLGTRGQLLFSVPQFYLAQLCVWQQPVSSAQNQTSQNIPVISAFMCFSTVKAFLQFQIPILLWIIRRYFFSSIRVISYEEGKALAESWNAAFLESSAKENQVTDLRFILNHSLMGCLRVSLNAGSWSICMYCTDNLCRLLETKWMSAFRFRYMIVLVQL